MEGVELEFTPDALRELAAQAIKKGTGARALRSLLEKLMLDVMYDVPTSDDIAGVTVTRPVRAGRSQAAPPAQERSSRRLSQPRGRMAASAEATRCLWNSTPIKFVARTRPRDSALRHPRFF